MDVSQAGVHLGMLHGQVWNFPAHNAVGEISAKEFLTAADELVDSDDGPNQGVYMASIIAFQGLLIQAALVLVWITIFVILLGMTQQEGRDDDE